MGVLYLLSHLVNLTLLPVFADEAIYIRWSQLIIDDWSRYLLFPLNDGKTPLFVWTLVPFQYLLNDPLKAGRLLSVLVGLVQLGVMANIAKSLGGKSRAVVLSVLLTAFSPFWYLHHRLALMEGMLVLWLSLAFWGVLKIQAQKSFTLKLASLKWPILTGLFFGLAMLTKLPAIIFAPILLLPLLVLPQTTKKSNKLAAVLATSGSIFLGLVIFTALKLHPAFGQLFARGEDFLYPAQQVLTEGLWRNTVINFPTYGGYFVRYLSLPVILLNFGGLFSKRRKRVHHLLIYSAILFALPIGLLGKVVYARYLLPSAIFLTLGAALAVEEFMLDWINKEKLLRVKLLNSVLLISLLLVIVQNSFEFVVYSLVNPNFTPFVESDAQQYLLKWSSGHGVKESVSLIQKMAKTKRVAVASEGFFGTLPDGLLMYLHRQDVSNIYVEGVGYPVTELTEKFVNRAQDFDRVLVVANSHRLNMDVEEAQLLLETCRPHGAPCLQVWDVTSLTFP